MPWLLLEARAHGRMHGNAAFLMSLAHATPLSSQGRNPGAAAVHVLASALYAAVAWLALLAWLVISDGPVLLVLLAARWFFPGSSSSSPPPVWPSSACVGSGGAGARCDCGDLSRCLFSPAPGGICFEPRAGRLPATSNTSP